MPLILSNSARLVASSFVRLPGKTGCRCLGEVRGTAIFRSNVLDLWDLRLTPEVLKKGIQQKSNAN